VEPIDAYVFDKGVIFDSFIKEMYEVKRDTKDPVERNLAKLLMNSLYGKFGMNPIHDVIEVIPKKDLDDYIKLHKTHSIVRETSDFSMVKRPIEGSTIDPTKILYTTTEGRSEAFRSELLSKSNVAIAAAITAYARIALSNLMRDESNPVFYHDTDSIIVQKPLDDKFVGPELGQMKLEHKIDHAVFAGPKLYGMKVSQAEIIKAKGYGSDGLTFDMLKGLLKGDQITVMKEY
jgi:hypothetical protein